MLHTEVLLHFGERNLKEGRLLLLNVYLVLFGIKSTFGLGAWVAWVVC